LQQENLNHNTTINQMIPYGRHYIEQDDIDAVVAQLNSGWLTQGPKVHEFETAVASYVGAKYAVAVSSGTAALHIACIAAGISQGDNVVVAPNSFVASANCVRYVNGNPEFSDIEPNSLNLSPDALAEKCRELKTVKGIIPVHFGGLPCNMPRITETAEKFGAKIIEDAAHALGSVYASGERVGSCRYSDMTIFSFHPVKAIACGEGGMITTNDKSIYRSLLRLRSHGINKNDDPYVQTEEAFQGNEINRWYYEMQELGFNFRLTDIQAALGLSQMGKLDKFIARRRSLAEKYNTAFLQSSTEIRAGQISGWGNSSHHLFIIRAPFGNGFPNRNTYMRKLQERGFITQVHYIPIPMHPYYRKLGHSMDRLPETLRYYREGLSIPLFYGLTDLQQQDFIDAAIKCCT